MRVTRTGMVFVIDDDAAVRRSIQGFLSRLAFPSLRHGARVLKQRENGRAELPRPGYQTARLKRP
jgi:FixJ family two-component response regulator